MRLDSNNKMINENGAETPEEVVEPRPNADELIDEILAEFVVDSRSLDTVRNGHSVPNSIFNMMQPPQTRTPVNSFSENATIDDIDPASDLGLSIRNKYLELEEIYQSLKSRLNVVVDESIVLSPDANSLDAELEHDLDTECQEDISLQEFLELLHSQNNINSTSVQ